MACYAKKVIKDCRYSCKCVHSHNKLLLVESPNQVILQIRLTVEQVRL